MTTVEVVTRAMSAAGRGCKYGLGKGGFDPAAPHPWNSRLECDCSGFVAWALGVSRHTDHPWYRQINGGWLETSAIVRDAIMRGLGMFDLVAWREARPGHLVVYGDSGGRQGHVGIVAEVGADGPLTAIHCSKGNEVRFGDAIHETGVVLWKERNGIVARCIMLEDAA